MRPIVEENVIDPGAEWTNRDKTEDRSRVSKATYTLADKGLNTTIDKRPILALQEDMASVAKQEGMAKEKSIDERSKTRKSRERNLVKANQMIRDKSICPNHCRKKLLGV